MTRRAVDEPRRRTRTGEHRVCQHCGYDHDDDFETELARRWHEANDASAGLDFDLDTLKGGWA